MPHIAIGADYEIVRVRQQRVISYGYILLVKPALERIDVRLIRRVMIESIDEEKDFAVIRFHQAPGCSLCIQETSHLCSSMAFAAKFDFDNGQQCQWQIHRE